MEHFVYAALRATFKSLKKQVYENKKFKRISKYNFHNNGQIFWRVNYESEDLVMSFVLSICVVFADLIETKNKIFFYF